MESLGNFLQNDIKFVQIPLVVVEILQFEIWWIPPFSAKQIFLKGRFSKTTASISIKLKILFFLYKLYKQTKFDTNQGFWGLKLNKFLVI